jgi:hypothetical protein
MNCVLSTTFIKFIDIYIATKYTKLSFYALIVFLKKLS